MKMEDLRTWLNNSEEVAHLLQKTPPRAFREDLSRRGLKPWLTDQILDGANPIDLYIKTYHYIHDYIPAKNQEVVWDVFWDTLNQYTK